MLCEFYSIDKIKRVKFAAASITDGASLFKVKDGLVSKNSTMPVVNRTETIPVMIKMLLFDGCFISFLLYVCLPLFEERRGTPDV